MSTWSENGEDIFVVFRENKRQGNCIDNKDILLDVELSHARTWALAFP